MQRLDLVERLKSDRVLSHEEDADAGCEHAAVRWNMQAGRTDIIEDIEYFHREHPGLTFVLVSPFCSLSL